MINFLRRFGYIRKIYLSIKLFYDDLRAKFYRYHFKKKYIKKITELRKKQMIGVGFLVSNISQWKSQSIYLEFLKDPRYEVSIYIVNENAYEPNGKKELYHALKVFMDNGINAIDGFSDVESVEQACQRIKTSDIVFYSRRPDWNGSLGLKKLTNSLTCYVPYSVHADLNHKLQYGTLFHQCLWKHYLPNEEFKKFAQSIYQAYNCEVFSYPGFDPFLDKNNLLIDFDAPKWNDSGGLRVIWAPHHTIEGGTSGPFFSTFLIYAKQMSELVCQSGNLQICFKPHPGLKKKLYNHDEWGCKKTDEYYSFWQNATNGFLHESIYHDLFLTADAIILDSVSFITEFSSLGKPTCFLTRFDKGDYTNYFNKVGYNAYRTIYKAGTWEELINFLNGIANFGNEENNYSNVNLPEDIGGKKIVDGIRKILSNA